MKKCSYCAEEIQDEAAKCRYCNEWLTNSSGNIIPKAENINVTLQRAPKVKSESVPSTAKANVYFVLFLVLMILSFILAFAYEEKQAYGTVRFGIILMYLFLSPVSWVAYLCLWRGRKNNPRTFT